MNVLSFIDNLLITNCLDESYVDLNINLKLKFNLKKRGFISRVYSSNPVITAALWALGKTPFLIEPILVYASKKIIF